jgi:ubiquinone/menaquinone biosynthesis C-methylase UbiE
VRTDEVVRLFDAMAGVYDDLEPWYEHLYARLHAIIGRALAPVTPTEAGQALDAGCGTGFQTGVLLALGYRVHGIDASSGLLALARTRLPAARFAQGRLEALPYPDGAFDVATCCGSTLSFVSEPATVVAELARVLRPGGRLLLEVEHKWSADLGWMAASALAGDALGYGVDTRALRRALARPLAESCVLPYPGYGELRLFTARSLRRLLDAAGLASVRAWGIHSATGLFPSTTLHRPRLPGPLRPLYRGLCVIDRWVARLPPARGLASSRVVLARKA